MERRERQSVGALSSAVLWRFQEGNLVMIGETHKVDVEHGKKMMVYFNLKIYLERLKGNAGVVRKVRN